MESEGSLPLLQVPATYPYSKADTSSPYRAIPHPKLHFNIILRSTPAYSEHISTHVINIRFAVFTPTPDPPSSPVSSGFPTKIMHAFHIYTILATCFRRQEF